MAAHEAPDVREARRRLAEFLAGRTDERLFRHPTGHPSRSTGFCHCDDSVLGTLAGWLKAVLVMATMNQPSNRLKVWLLRRLGARIGRDVFISVGAWIDPTYPQLLTIEDGVFIGTGARLVTHEFRVDEFRAGKIILRRGAFVGGFSLVPCGVEVGEGAVVAAGAVVALDVPPHTTATGNPAFIWKRKPTADRPGAEHG